MSFRRSTTATKVHDIFPFESGVDTFINAVIFQNYFSQILSYKKKKRNRYLSGSLNFLLLQDGKQGITHIQKVSESYVRCFATNSLSKNFEVFAYWQPLGRGGGRGGLCRCLSTRTKVLDRTQDQCKRSKRYILNLVFKNDAAIETNFHATFPPFTPNILTALHPILLYLRRPVHTRPLRTKMYQK